jgi:hypothetical protein
MYRDTTHVEHEMYHHTSNNWSHGNSNIRFKGKSGSHTRKAFNRFNTKDSYTKNITHNIHSIAIWNLNTERWGSTTNVNPMRDVIFSLWWIWRIWDGLGYDSVKPVHQWQILIQRLGLVERYTVPSNYSSAICDLQIRIYHCYTFIYLPDCIASQLKKDNYIQYHYSLLQLKLPKTHSMGNLNPAFSCHRS